MKNLYLCKLRQMKTMKRVIGFLLLIVFFAILASSCKSSQSCPAYGEAKKFQIERRY
jgi:hypothetical protein